MLTPYSRHKKLNIVLSPQGEYWHPTYPLGYEEGHAWADLLSGKHKYFFQRVEIVYKRGCNVSGSTKVWKALDETRGLDSLGGWTILPSSDRWVSPVTPGEAGEERNKKVKSIAG